MFITEEIVTPATDSPIRRIATIAFSYIHTFVSGGCAAGRIDHRDALRDAGFKMDDVIVKKPPMDHKVHKDMVYGSLVKQQ